MPLIEGLEITTLAAEGKAMGHHEGVVIFVPMTIPGDIVDVQITKRHRRFMEGRVVRFVHKSENRVEPICKHFGVCGGCKWQNLPYQTQLDYKTQQVCDQLVRIGKLEIPEVRPCLGSAEQLYYRNKIEYTFADRRWLTYEEIAEQGDIAAAPALGFHIPNMFDKILDIDECHLQASPSNEIRNFIKSFCIENGYSFHNARAHEGLMRGIILRTASTGDIMLTIIFNENDKERISALYDAVLKEFPQITSAIYFINEKWNDSTGDLTPICYAGKDHIMEEMEGLQFKVGPKSFYQTNSKQAYELYKVTRDFAELREGDTLYDLYTGTGTIANFCAKRCKKVVGIEYVP